MKKVLFILFLAWLSTFFGCTTASKSVSTHSREDFSEYWSSFSIAKMSDDGNLVYSVFLRNQIWQYNIKSKTSKILTTTENDINFLFLDPEGNYLLVGTVKEDDTKSSYEILNFNLKTEKYTTLWKTDANFLDICDIDANSKSFTFVYAPFSNSRGGVYLTTLSKDGFFNVDPELIVEPTLGNECGYITKDKKEYVFTRKRGIPTSYLYSQNLVSKTLIPISVEPGIETEPIRFSSLENGYYALSNINSDFKQVYNFSADGKATQKTFEKWDVEQIYQAESLGLIFIITNEDGYSKLKIADAQFRIFQNIDLPFTYFRFKSFSVDGQKILLKAATDKKQPELYLYEWKSGNLAQVTAFNKLNFSDSDLVPAKTVHLESDDHSKFSAVIYEPYEQIKNSVAIISVHGGPEDQEIPIYDTEAQYWANQGYTVIKPNFRGSTGYGKKFESKIFKDWGSHLKDIKATRSYLIKSLGFKENKIAIAGYSFGGYSAAFAITQYPKDYCAAVSGLGVYNLIKHNTEVPDYWAGYTTDGLVDRFGSLITSRDKLITDSPYFNADKIRSPFLIVWGEKDRKVFKGQSEQFVEKLTQLNVPFEKTIYENEGHGFSKYWNQIFSLKDSTSFIDKHCL